jgi:hypothetical protein
MFRKLSVGLVALFGLGLSSAEAQPPQPVVCHDENVNPLSGFNAGATCVAPLSTVTGGGYQLTSASGDLLGMTVNESMPNLSGGPHGWQVVGNNTTTIPGKIRVCAICR